ncbi:MAG TPA: M20/M25/M40 family metallo-hydrolase [Gaiellaceae bacterium]|jgi:acetylornithine deacetylase/succinyl-diaminopimelate desuccinylase-like protein
MDAKYAPAVPGSEALRDEVTQLLQELIRVNTVNPPGNETAAAELLRDYLAESGVESELYAKAPERANLVARLPGRGGGPSLLLLSHTDTVVADPSEWQVDPWSGELLEGEIWGRGALDMKGEVAASAVAIASLARDGFEPAGDVVFVAAADEEVGAGFGLPWLCEEHPEAVRADYALNEGAGERIELAGRALYLCSTAEKMSSPFRVRVHGRAGHASMPGIADNALTKAAPLIERLAAYRPELRLEGETDALVQMLAGQKLGAEEALALARELDPFAAETLEPLLSLTLSPTMISASERRNVIPSTCDVVVDCRLLPGQTQEEVEPLLREVLGDGDYDFEWMEGQGGTRSPLETPLWDAVAGFVKEVDPEAALAPICVAGFTDSHWLRERFGTVAYGFFPMRTMDTQLASRLIHSADERANVEDLELGVQCFRHVARAVCG